MLTLNLLLLLGSLSWGSTTGGGTSSWSSTTSGTDVQEEVLDVLTLKGLLYSCQPFVLFPKFIVSIVVLRTLAKRVVQIGSTS